MSSKKKAKKSDTNTAAIVIEPNTPINTQSLKEIGVDLKVCKNDILELIAEQLKEQLLEEIRVHNEAVENFITTNQKNVDERVAKLVKSVEVMPEVKNLQKNTDALSTFFGQEKSKVNIYMTLHEQHYQLDSTFFHERHRNLQGVDASIKNAAIEFCDRNKSKDCVVDMWVMVNRDYSLQKVMLQNELLFTGDEVTKLVEQAVSFEQNAVRLWETYKSIESKSKKAKLEMTRQILAMSGEGQNLLKFVASKSILSIPAKV